MSQRALRVVLVAEEAAGVQVLGRLIALGSALEIVAVLSSDEAKEGRRPLVRDAAVRAGLPVSPAELVRSPDLADRVRDEGVDLLLNVHSLFIVHSDVVAAPRIGSFNLHPGPLPEYAGLNVPSWAVYNDEKAHAATVHWMDDGIDTGPVAWSARFALTDSDTGLSVSGKAVREGVPLMIKVVEAAARDPSALPRVEQDASRRRYFGAGPPNDGQLDWSRPAAEVVRFVRAADYSPFQSPWGHPQAELGGRRVGVLKASATTTRANATPGTVLEVDERGAFVATGDDLVFVERIVIDGRAVRPRALFGD